MRILLVNQFFHPDSVATAQLLTDLAGALSSWGHSVTVICGQPDEAGGSPTLNGNVEIVRIGNRAFSRDTGARLASYATFLAGAMWAAWRVKRPDIVVTLTTPPFVSIIGTLLKRRAPATRHYIWEMDVYPDVATDLDVLSGGSFVTRFLGWFADLQRRRADGIIALGDCMRRRLQLHGIAPERIHVCENWADSRIIRPLPAARDGVLRVLYSGNFGLAHDSSTIQAALDRLQDDMRFHFVFSGGGARRAALLRSCAQRNATNVTFLPYQPKEDLSAAFGAASLGLVTQRPECTGSVVPSKVYGLMAARRPYLFIGPRGAMPARLIERFSCGWQVDPGDTDGLVQLLEGLAKSPHVVQGAGERAYAAFLDHYDLPMGVGRIAGVLGLPRPAQVMRATAAAA